jgi:tetratricopeptide (TPR) repeat protein
MWRFMISLRILLVGCVLLGGKLASGDDIDTEAARRHFERGRTLYDLGTYPEACAEFAAAKRLLDLPALDFNIGKCEERLEHWDAAVEAYERYLARASTDDSATDVRRRLAILRTRLAPDATAPDPRVLRLRKAAIGVAVGAFAIAGAATGAYFSVWSDYRHEVKLCTGAPCSPNDYSSLSDRVHAAQVAGYTLWGLAGALAVTDAALWVLATKKASATHAQRGAAGLGVRF